MDRFSRIRSVDSSDRHDGDVNRLTHSSQSFHTDSVRVVLASILLDCFHLYMVGYTAPVPK